MSGKPGMKKGVKNAVKATETEEVPDSCSNCLSHREGQSAGMFAGKLWCHFYPEPTVCRSRDHWCRQWEAEGGTHSVTIGAAGDLSRNARSATGGFDTLPQNTA